jgi:thiamine pyrophosphate-dependent acetolactate synthase large subunit-like protein
MRALDVIEALAAVRGDAAVVTGPGGLAGAVYVTSPHPASIYNMEFGYATSTAFGIALGAPDRRSIAVEGDGSFVAAMSVLTTIARYRPPNLVVVVVDNGIFGTGAGTVQTATSHGTDIAALARAAGLPEAAVRAPGTPDALAADLGRAMNEPGPWLLHVRVELDDTRDSSRRPRPGVDFVEASIRFQAEFRDGS